MFNVLGTENGTFESLRPNTIEEAFRTFFDALMKRDYKGYKERIG